MRRFGTTLLSILFLVSLDGSARVHARIATAPAPKVCFGDTRHGFLARANHVWTSPNGGRSWRLRFTGQFLSPSKFSDTVGCSGSTAWVLFTGFGAASNQKPYVLYRTLDGGLHWRAEAEEGYFGSVYPKAKARRYLGGYPGPLTVVSPLAAYFLGFNLPIGAHGRVELTGTTTAGRTWRQHPVPCIWALKPVRFSFTSALHGWVSGICAGRRTLEITRDGGRTWSRSYLP